MNDLDDGTLARSRSIHRTDRPIWAKGTIEMDHLGVPVDISGNEAQKMLTEMGKMRSRMLVQNAQRYPCQHQNHPRNH